MHMCTVLSSVYISSAGCSLMVYDCSTHAGDSKWYGLGLWLSER